MRAQRIPQDWDLLAPRVQLVRRQLAEPLLYEIGLPAYDQIRFMRKEVEDARRV